MSAARAIATVVTVTGKAYVRTLDGHLKPLQPGDVIHEGELIMTSADGRVQVDFGDNSAIEMTPNQAIKVTDELLADLWPDEDQGSIADTTVDRIIEALADGRDLNELLEAPAAGESVGGDDGNNFIRLMRVVEAVDPVAFNFPDATIADRPDFDGFADNDNDNQALDTLNPAETLTPSEPPTTTPLPSFP